MLTTAKVVVFQIIFHENYPNDRKLKYVQILIY